MIVIIGDSNFRELYNSHNDQIEEEVSEKILFRQATTNESLKLALAEESEDGEKPKLIIVGANLNEIVTRIAKNPKKGRDEVVKTVVMEQNCAINKWAWDNPSSMVLLVPPFLRLDPVWREERLKWVRFCMRDDINVYSPGTVQLSNGPDIIASDLKEDKVHLLESGLKKLAEVMTSDIKVGLRDVEKIRTEDFDMETETLESSQFADQPSKTPLKTAKKRARNANADGTSPDYGKKSREDKGDRAEEMMDKIDQLVREMREERVTTIEKLVVFEKTQEEVKAKQKSTDTKVRKLTRMVENDSTLMASMKEDIDAGENESMKDTVVVKRMKTDLEIPKEKKALAKFVQVEGRKLVGEIMGSDDDVRYVATLYNNNNTNPNPRRPPKENEEGPTIPPFKLVFKSKDKGIQFREKAVAKAKEEGSEMGKI